MNTSKSSVVHLLARFMCAVCTVFGRASAQVDTHKHARKQAKQANTQTHTQFSYGGNLTRATFGGDYGPETYNVGVRHMCVCVCV